MLEFCGGSGGTGKIKIYQGGLIDAQKQEVVKVVLD